MVLALADARDARLIGVEATSGGVPGLHPVSPRERHKAQTWDALLDRKLVCAAGERWGRRYPITDEGMRVADKACPPPNLPALRAALAERRGVAVAREDDAYKRLDAARSALRAALDDSPSTRDAEKLSAQWIEACLSGCHTTARAGLGSRPAGRKPGLTRSVEPRSHAAS